MLWVTGVPPIVRYSTGLITRQSNTATGQENLANTANFLGRPTSWLSLGARVCGCMDAVFNIWAKKSPAGLHQPGDYTSYYSLLRVSEATSVSSSEASGSGTSCTAASSSSGSCSSAGSSEGSGAGSSSSGSGSGSGSSSSSSSACGSDSDSGR